MQLSERQFWVPKLGAMILWGILGLGLAVMRPAVPDNRALVVLEDAQIRDKMSWFEVLSLSVVFRVCWEMSRR